MKNGKFFGRLIVRIIEKFGINVFDHRFRPKITNPSCKLINPFTLMINFTLDNTDKYQLVLQGDYKEYYKEAKHKKLNIPENELFILINQSQDKWYKKY